MNSSLVEKVSHFLDSLGIVDDIERAGINLQPPLKPAPYWVTLVDHLKNR